MIITSISTADKVYETMSKPLRIYGSDFRHYIAKFGKAHDLLNEFIAARFCILWDIKVPSVALIRLLPEHIPTGLNKRHFNQLGFGSEYLEHALELTNFLLTWKNNTYEINRIVNRVDLLRIGLFDLWMANEDRNHNNANLLIQPSNDGFYLVAIDHVNIFNTNSLHRGLFALSEESSILYSQYIPLFFRTGDKLMSAMDLLEKDFPNRVARCQEELKPLLQSIPKEWGIDIAIQEKQMGQLFSLEWTQEVIHNFKLYIARNFT